MNEKLKEAIKEYQCSGCVSGPPLKCFTTCEAGGKGCGSHIAGTLLSGIGKIFLGLPKGFNRLGVQEGLIPKIFETIGEMQYDHWNVPAWKFLNKEGHTLIRGIMPRRNEPFLHIFLEDCRDKIECREITQEEIDNMD